MVHQETMRNTVILCDFDNTISRKNVANVLFEKFAGCGLEHTQRWEMGEISSKEEYMLNFAAITASKEEMESHISTVEIDPGFKSLLDFSFQKGYELAIVSDGLEWYISYILARHHIKDVPIYANYLYFENQGFRLEFPWYGEETPRVGVCKPEIVRSYQNPWTRVVYIGDGLSDVDVANVADIIFAKGVFLEHCLAHGIPAVCINSLSDVIENWI
jgi:2-hydroxy-3-keto-5-methylthiopentenyl-1-phosphate phosphatase